MPATTQFALGQRWISDTEPDLGLGTILELQARQLTIVFLACGETRNYSTESAPITRLTFMPGDSVQTQDDLTITIADVHDQDGFLIYRGLTADGESLQVPESELSHHLRFNNPAERLFAGQLDRRRWYNLRRDVLNDVFANQQSNIKGLVGGRISLVPHQLYVAHNVSSRLHPRVLLADEVGLGKTIEAGLIVHRQLVNHQIQRVLVIVPEPLLHQWLVEMLRRFNLHFHIMNSERFADTMAGAPNGNPFLLQQLVLCSLESLLEDPLMADSAVSAGWDTLVVDEAHHLTWTQEAPSPAYLLVEELAQTVPSILLLTATPEQLGVRGHFARLRLLDPNRFADFDEFMHEDTQHTEIASIASALLDGNALDSEQLDSLTRLPGIDMTDEQRIDLLKRETENTSPDSFRNQLLERLLDQHGTSRVLFRNTRSAVSGFPERRLDIARPEQLETMADYAVWIKDLLLSLYPERVLLICSSQTTVESLIKALQKLGIDSAGFHEGMSIVERDRAAAWFADKDDGTQLLCCSEIGSEGRNFQFLHHLITFELPSSPDLLEQRIGRLDRIGQLHDIDIHVPVTAGSRDYRLLNWYHEGLNAFEQTCATGHAVKKALRDQLDNVLDAESDEQLPALVEETRRLNAELRERLESGRDRLLEINSNRSDLIAGHLDAMAREDRDFTLSDLTTRLFDAFGVENEQQTNGTVILHPGDHMQVSSFPGLPEDGLTVTFDRQIALEREDVTYLTRDHPMITASMDLVLNEAYGQTNAEVIDTDLLPKGVLYLETNFTWHCVAEKRLLIERYFPVALKRFLLGSNRKDYTASLDKVDLDRYIKRSERSKLKNFIDKGRKEISLLLKYSDSLAANMTAGIQAEARATIDAELTPEIERLEALRLVNPTVRPQEIDDLRTRKAQLEAALDTAQHQLLSVSILLNL